MRIPKRYGESKIENCPFCGRQAIIVNEQGVPVCISHKDSLIPEMRCVCGEYLLMQKGKFGIYFNCLRCGNMNFKKILELNDITKPETPLEKGEAQKQDKPKPNQQDRPKPVKEEKPVPKNIVIRSDDPDYFD